MSSITTCTQPQCPLRDAEVDSDLLAQLIVEALAGNPVQLDTRIVPSERCFRCVENVMRGGRPVPTPTELDEALVEGRRSYRRSRRGARREAHQVE